MTSWTVLSWVVLPILITGVLDHLYRHSDLVRPMIDQLPSVLLDRIATVHCYQSVNTLSTTTSTADDCFRVVNGKFTNLFRRPSSDKVNSGHVIPGLWDGHGHLLQYGESLESVNLFGAQSIKQVQDRLLEYKQARPEVGSSTQWLRGGGWDQANFGGKWPTSADLSFDQGFNDLFVMLDRVDVHCIWVSDRVLDLLPSQLPEKIPGGEIPAKGVFCDNAMDIVLNHYPKPNPARKATFAKNAMRELNRLGIVGMHDAGVVPSDLNLYTQLASDNDWTVRVYAMIECDVRNTFCPEEVKKISTNNGKLHVRGVKLFADGALGSWGSAMLLPYTDKPDSSGSLLVNATILSRVTNDWATAGYQVNIHAIGDLANRLAIDAFEAALKNLCPGLSARKCQARHRFRTEHAQIIHPDDQRRMLELGIIPSIQPTHATSDMGYAESRLGPKRTKTEAYRMRSLVPIRPILGSDFPVEPASILEGIYSAITRRSPRTGLDPSGGTVGWYPEETLDMREALKGFTINPAYGAFLEGKAGVIEKGAYADWVVLDEPLENMNPESLRSASVRETWVAGKRVYHRP